MQALSQSSAAHDGTGERTGWLMVEYGERKSRKAVKLEAILFKAGGLLHFDLHDMFVSSAGGQGFEGTQILR